MEGWTYRQRMVWLPAMWLPAMIANAYKLDEIDYEINLIFSSVAISI